VKSEVWVLAAALLLLLLLGRLLNGTVFQGVPDGARAHCV